jgi:hypothetical protein
MLSDAERLQRIYLGQAFARFMCLRRNEYLARIEVADREFLRRCGVSPL